MRWGPALLAVLVLLVAAPSAEAYVWWQNWVTGDVGRAENDAAPSDPAFADGLPQSGGVASNGTYVWWGRSGGNTAGGTIGRASAAGDGSDANETWSSSGGQCGVFDLAANASDVYWLHAPSCSGNSRQIRRTGVNDPNNSGGLIDHDFICGFGLDATHLYYGYGPRYIGRADLDGSDDDPTWLDTGGNNYPCDVVADATHVYYSFGPGANQTRFGRAAINGTAPNNSWATLAAGDAYYSDQIIPATLAQDSTYVYWAAQKSTGGNGTIGRILKSTGVASPAFITGLGAPSGLAVDALGPGADTDGDGVPDSADNCINVDNPDQANSDGDAAGDACDTDDDNDGVNDGADNCPAVANPGQEDQDGDGTGNACDPDADVDGDGIPDASDNCPSVANPDQQDADGDKVGRACDSQDNPPPPPPMRVVGVDTSNAKFAAGGSSTPIRGTTSQKKKGKVPRGTVFSFRLNQDAAVTIDILRKKGGRKVKRKCRKPTRKNRGKKRCNLRVARLFRDAHGGVNEMPFTGRIRGRALKPGRYAAVFTAVGEGGRSRAKVGFRVVRP